MASIKAAASETSTLTERNLSDTIRILQIFFKPSADAGLYLALHKL